MAGQTFTLNVVVRNQGSGSSKETTLRYYQSTDSAIMLGDSEVGTDQVSGLDLSGSNQESISLTASSTPGTYYYGACVDSVSGESDITNNCSAVATVTVSAFGIENLSWVVDGITDDEQRAMDHIRAFAAIDTSMSERVAGSLWLSDGVTEDDLQMMADLRSLADSNAETAALVTTIPDQTGRLMRYVLTRVQEIRHRDPARWNHLLSQTWLQDGLTEEEAALIVTVAGPAGYHSEETFQDLLQDGHVRSETISLPLAGEVDLFVVSSSKRDLMEDALDKMAFAIKSMEGYMGTPWPTSDAIALQGFELDLGPLPGGLHAGDHIVLRGSEAQLVYHEVAHFYFKVPLPQWLNEGAAEFLADYTDRLTGGALPVGSSYFTYLGFITEICAPHGWDNVQGWIENKPDGLTNYFCPYMLGRVFLEGMHRALGNEVVVSALRELHGRSLDEDSIITEEDIYRAFLTNTPSTQRDEFHYLYLNFHGRPTPGYVAVPKAPPSSEIKEALVAFYHATGGPGWKNDANWLSEAPVDQWYGVVTDYDGSVIGIILRENHLVGPVPPEVGALSDLEWLWLSGNQLTGSIPPGLSDLSNLTGLLLSDNQLSGQIPSWLGSFSDLEVLHLGGNQLIGPIPSELGDLSHLRQLEIGSNQLAGPIPPELGNLSHLARLRLTLNRLTGPIPAELGDLSHLRWLEIGGNRLSGPIPPELGDLPHLEQLSLSANWLTGPIPPELGDLSQLIRLGLGDNPLTGPIPPELGDLSHLQDLYLYGSRLTGPIPPELGDLPQLIGLYLDGNQLTGCVPTSLRSVDYTDLDELGLPNCGDGPNRSGGPSN